MKKKLVGLLISLFVLSGVFCSSELEAVEENENYRWLIEPKYRGSTGYSEGLWAVSDGKAYGYVDSMDRTILPFRYRRAFPFKDGLALALISSDNVVLDMSQEKDLRIFWGVIDREGEYVMPPRLGVRRPDRGDAWGLLPFYAEGYRSGFLNLSGDIQIPAVYKDYRSFSEGLAAVKSGDSFGVIDINGEWVISPNYRNLLYFYHGYIPFLKNGLWGFLDREGKVVVDPKYTDINISLDGTDPIIVTLDGKLVFLDEDLHEILKSEYKDVRSSERPGFSNIYTGGVAFVYDAGTYKALDREGKVLFDHVVDKDGRKLFELSAMWVKPYIGNEGYYVLKTYHKGAFLIDKKGELILPPEFDVLEPPRDGIVTAVKNGLCGLLLLKQR